MKKGLFLVCFILTAAFSSAQIEFRVDSTSIRIGDQIKATLIIPISPGQIWSNQTTLWPDSLVGIEKVGDDHVITQTDRIIAEYRLSFFDSGRVVLPALPVVLSPGSDTQWTPAIPIDVSVVEPDSSGLQPIKDIQEEPFRPGYYLRYWPYGLAFLVLCLVAWYYWRKRKSKPEIVEAPPAIVLSPDVWALGELEILSQRSLWQRGEIKAYYTQLTDIFREYLEKQFHIRAQEQTTDEIQKQLSKQNLSVERVRDVGDLLEIADLIKFAKADPGTNVHEQAIERVRTFIRSVPSQAKTIAEG